MVNRQLERQAVSHKAILDFTVQRLPQMPEAVIKRFPELKSTAQEFEKLRINLQLQLREQFVAIREMLERVATVERIETVRETVTTEIQKIENKITNITNVVNVGSVGKATKETLGTVKTDKTIDDPLVYLKVTVDELLAALESEINTLITNVSGDISNITSTVFGNAIPLVVLTSSGLTPNFPLIQGVSGIFGNQRAVNVVDFAWWTWAGDPYFWVPG